MISPLDPSRYGSPTAFNTALEARLREASGGDHKRLAVMRTQFAISRLLVRLQETRPDEWVVKGGTSMLARLDGRCRLSRDLDLLYHDLARVGDAGLRGAIGHDAGDWLRFHIEDSRALQQDEVHGVRFRMSARVDAKELVRFGVDVVEEAAISGGLERRVPYSPVAITGAPNPAIPLYPVEDHVADKVSAMGKTRPRNDGTAAASTRYRDLADLALLATSVPIESAPLLAALRAPARHWAPDAFGETGLRVPGPEWPERYAAMVKAEPYVVGRWPTADAALAAAKPLVDSALAGTAQGTWDPVAATWRG